MKKLSIVFLFACIVTTSIFASSEDARLTINGAITERFLTTAVSYYNSETSVWDDLSVYTDTNSYAIQASNALTQAGHTNDFRITYSSNKEVSTLLTVNVTPSSFYRSSGTVENDSIHLTPSVLSREGMSFSNTDGVYTGSTTLSEGNHTDEVATQFYLAWNGNPNLPSGDYESNIEISYTTE